MALDIAFLSLNNLRAPLDDRRVRQAIAPAVDREGIVSEILAGHGQPARNPLPPAIAGYAQRTRALVFDRRAARRLLAEAGLPDGFEARLMAVDAPRPYMPRPLALARLLREQLAEVGIRLTLDVVPSWFRYLERGSRGEYEMAVLGWQADTTDPNDTLTALVGSESIGDDEPQPLCQRGDGRPAQAGAHEPPAGRQGCRPGQGRPGYEILLPQVSSSRGDRSREVRLIDHRLEGQSAVGPGDATLVAVLEGPSGTTADVVIRRGRSRNVAVTFPLPGDPVDGYSRTETPGPDPLGSRRRAPLRLVCAATLRQFH